MDLRELRIDHIVIGTGAAGFQAALRLYGNGEKNLAIVTDHVKAGTSRNTGSDKQTYYILSLAGGDPDSVRAMAEDLFQGQCVDGDQALCEAALSVRGFFRLVELGVPFPCTEQGEFMGYKTDHDRGRRATSAGPYTSKMMTECLEEEVKRSGILVMEGLQAIRFLVDEKRVYGLLCLDLNSKEEAFVLIWCQDVIMATGGPAGIYSDSVYPNSQLGGSGMAFEAGAAGKNLTEWQFGLASLNPRWNVSGTYMQVLPKVVSANEDGTDEREFLLDFFENSEIMLSMVFLKGYQWPFDVNKIWSGSSVIDLLVYQESVLKGRKIYLDFTQNTGNREIPFERLDAEAYDYLKQAGALFGTPIERLEKMNEPAIQFYLDHGVDLRKDKLEIAVCAQHNNGGLSTDSFWETNIQGLFAAGEVCGSHGVARPGGTALNAGQVGAMRAAEKIHLRSIHTEAFKTVNREAEENLRKEAIKFAGMAKLACGEIPLSKLWNQAAKRMSAKGGMIRQPEKLAAALKAVTEEVEAYPSLVKKPEAGQLSLFYRLRDMLITQKVYLSAMLDYAQRGGGSRGSALYTDPDGKLPDERLPEIFRCRLDGEVHGAVVQEIVLEGDHCRVKWRPVRPIPDVDYFFENQWRAYRNRQKV